MGYYQNSSSLQVIISIVMVKYEFENSFWQEMHLYQDFMSINFAIELPLLV